ncbi:MAG: toprim domain-containing protein [Alistipes sp.]|nr:toprim domain-containing protein [Alistipes sp.]
MKTIQDIKRLSIRDYLHLRGIDPKYGNVRYGFYHSPLRSERTPSFKVDYVQNLWYDFGTGEGGSIIDLVMRLEHCTFTQAVERLGKNDHIPAVIAQPLPPASALQVLSDSPLAHPALLDYLTVRAIDPAIAAAYCREVRYTVSDKLRFAIGFPNDAGGWELRSARFKGSSRPKYITIIDNGSDTAVVFEGFMDFLAYLTLKRADRLTVDAAVLNSVVNLPKALPFLQRHATVHTFMDNDDAGQQATDAIIRRLSECEVIDHSCFYRSHKDVNDYLLTIRRPQQRQSPAKRGMKI